MNSLQHPKAPHELFEKLAQTVASYPAKLEHVREAAEKVNLPKAAHALLDRFHTQIVFDSADDLLEKVKDLVVLEQAKTDAPEEELRSLQW